ncbi:aromatic amino acid aminotransferase apoenzyme [Palleronia marisminoris]|uniref:Aminotransferase n=1 Tax=Palleronia marisminoris TaxID=315423 RepID=A0A1Y5T278_9RHOB|nr:amino acid aminotransferase [Palleronia marisminoris]SFH08159.1 aromatic amino acid aminotransferase apoenzyme [Palleronia marisminoris]SLN52130.1 Aromatic-amino-acid aminotransferase [Palleronia marisminoris]
MLGNLKDQPADKILMLMASYREDPRDDKIDLGVGVYKDPDGNTPIMSAVKKAEERLLKSETTKSYTALSGDPAYAQAMRELVFGETGAADRVAAIATPGGTGAFRQGVDLIRMANPGATIWVSAPTWPNHLSILKTTGTPFVEYRYFDATTGGVDFDGMVADLNSAKEGDVVLLHGCCHNPTGANLTADQWHRVAEILLERKLVPMVDLAYQGFGDGLDDDAQGTRILAETQPELLVGASCSKNFGIYRERAGILFAIGDASDTKTVQGNLNHLNRQNYSFPPDHGPRIVTTILNDPQLRAEWQAELEEMRSGMLALRKHLADELRQRLNDDRFDFIARHRGMFSRLGVDADKVEAMRRDHGIYMVGDSRLNIAGLNARTVPILAEAIAKTCA